MPNPNEQQSKERGFSLANLKHRLSGLIAHVFIARGWIKPSGKKDEYKLTSKGKKALEHNN